MKNIKKYRKANIPKALREQVWLETFGKVPNFTNVTLI